jgi:hypothetical protein
MSLTRTMLSASLIWLSVATTASAVEVLPMESAEPECGSAQSAEVPAAAALAQEPVELVIEAAETPAGLQSVGSGGPASRPNPQAGGDVSVPPSSKPSSRWNAFLPGMVR